MMESIVEMDLQVGLSPMEQAGLVMRILGARVQVVEQVSERAAAVVHSYYERVDVDGLRGRVEDSVAIK
ncbi:hypothetical protein [Alicyclobacillus fastidiosus]|uniref:Uncharacterized protein n=1 Tax=Alicyclobacillus fastidiosus TaxID=392011 RepID=A0ABV5AGF6_9BACL|nr:hypothetical protein [Alicyclobacillus fastidiosus]WEH08958.1 hypothetical protein PYS47_20085 [Alicyclobacillus fastidiosus]